MCALEKRIFSLPTSRRFRLTATPTESYQDRHFLVDRSEFPRKKIGERSKCSCRNILSKHAQLPCVLLHNQLTFLSLRPDPYSHFAGFTSGFHGLGLAGALGFMPKSQT